MSRTRNCVITMRTARQRYPALNPLFDDITRGCREIVVKEGGVLPKAVARSTARQSGKVTIGFRLIRQGVLMEVPDGVRVRKMMRQLDTSHVVEISTTDTARRSRRIIAAATVTIYHTAVAS